MSRAVRLASATRRRRWGRLAALLLLVVLAIGVLVAWRAWHVRADLNQAREVAADLQQAIDRQDAPAARTALDELQRHSAGAARQTDGPVWRALGAVPVVGSDVRTVGVISDVLAEIARDGLTPLVDIAEQIDSGALAPQGRRVPVDRIAGLEGPVELSVRTFDGADAALAGRPRARLDQVANAQEELGRVIRDAQQRLGPVRSAVRTLPAMLGADGPRRYLLALQNNAEIRSTGGFAGSTFVLVADDGHIQLARSVPGNTFPVLDAPVLPLTAEEQSLFPPVVGTMMVNANRIPDFPRAADLWLAHWERRFGERLDGVVSTDPVLLSYLLKGKPPVDVQGVRLDSGNVVQELLSGTYARLTDPQAQDAFFQEVGLEVFDRVLSVDDPRRFLDAVRRGADEGRLLVHSSRGAEQRVVEEAGIGGELEAGPARRLQVGVYINDATGTTGSKMSYYLDYQAEVSALGCSRGRQELEGVLKARSRTPPDPTTLPLYVTGGSPDVPLGAQDLEVYLLGPSGGDLEGVTLDGEPPVVSRTVRYRGSPAVRVSFRLHPGQRAVVRWWMRTAAGQDGPTNVDVTPSVQPGTESSSARSLC